MNSLLNRLYSVHLHSLKSLSKGSLTRKVSSGLSRDKSVPKLPKPNARNILITSALPYVNNVPHLGNIIGCVLSADVYSRYCRLRNYNSIYICGTDEYGTATETKALQEKTSPKAICDKYHALHKQIYDWFQIDFDVFGRTTTEKQTEITSAIFGKLRENGQLSERKVQQCFCEQCQRFLADRYVVGTCPSCHFGDARGDQCDKCGTVLDPEELVSPKCAICAGQASVKESKHVFLDLPKIKPELEKWVEGRVDSGEWSNNCVRTTESWIRDGIKPRCITRDLKWGTPVPMAGYENKVFYVWFDAPIGYISITANYSESWEKWWKNPEEVELVQFMGKDNITFHTVLFPSTLIGTKENWTMLKRLSSTEYLNYEDGKFSKSRGIGVFGDSVAGLNLSAEVFRYYLLSNRPEVADSVFKWSDLAEKNNNELLANLGNLFNRLLKFVESKKLAVIKSPLHKAEHEILNLAFLNLQQYLSDMEEIRLKSALKTVMELSMMCNKYLQDSEFWKLSKTDPAKLNTVIYVSCNLIRLVSLLIEPFLPSVSAKVNSQLGIVPSPREETLLEELAGLKNSEKILNLLSPGTTANNVQAIFRSISPSEVSDLKTKFSGKQFN